VQKYYLTEPIHVTTTGVVQGKSIRCYECTETVATNTSNQVTSRKYTAAGRVFSVNNGVISSKPTKASLTYKYVSYRSEPLATLPTTLKNWGCLVFTSPELALRYKATRLQQLSYKMIERMQSSLTSIIAIADNIPDTSFIVNQNPELFV